MNKHDLLEQAMYQYIENKFNMKVLCADPTIQDRYVLNLIIYLFDDMQDMSSEQLSIVVGYDTIAVRSDSKIQLDSLEGFKQLLNKDIKHHLAEDTHNITNVSYREQICLLPLLFPKKFKGFIVGDTPKKFENVLIGDSFLVDIDRVVADKIRRSDEYKTILAEQLSKLEEIIFDKQKEKYEEDCIELKTTIQETKSRLQVMYRKLRTYELILLGCSTKEGDIKDNINDLIDVITSSSNIEITNMDDRKLSFTVSGYYSIWRDEYLKTTLQKISSLTFVKYFYRDCPLTTEEASIKLYKLIFEKRRLKVKVNQNFYFDYSQNKMIGTYTAPTDKGITNIHIGVYNCWDESQEVICEYLKDYRYADAVMQTVNSAFAINLYDSAVLSRLAEELYSCRTEKLLVDSKTNEELTLIEVLGKIEKGEYDEDIV